MNDKTDRDGTLKEKRNQLKGVPEEGVGPTLNEKVE